MPWIISLAIHAAVFVGGFFVVWQIAPSDDGAGEPVVVSFERPAPMPAPDEAAPDEVARATSAEIAPAIGEEAAPELPSIDELLAQMEAERSPSTDAQRDLSRELLMGETGARRVTFAGLGAASAQSVVYVVDASGSMVSTLPLVKEELKRSIGRLSQTQRFQVIFFKGFEARGSYEACPHPMDADARVVRLIAAFPEFVDEVSAWIDSVEAAGRSNPIPAIEAALALEPDAVFVLSTGLTGFGDWEPDKAEILARIDRMNPRDPRTGRRPVTIKTIQFLEDDRTGILRGLGEEHGGMDGYRFLRRGELGDRP